ncbi:MAG: DUF2845 domain-containing protein [Gammaproteobacteria bacterium]|nr:DUF2845 domain-containing protein [Gammaproteobacteria bacterium]NND59854.1 DUF2845 domain-containing protein [Gammaproteobacteria bacterium]
MRRILIQLGAVLVASAVISLPAQAMRCGNRIVGEGDIVGYVLAICGEPAATRSWTEVREQLFFAPRRDRLFYRHGSRGRGYWLPVEIVVEEWTYNLGTRRFMRILRFENGNLVNIRTTRYGYSE